MLFLKALPANRLAYGNFLWPDQVGAIVESTTWDPRPVCGGGLHGLINAEGRLDLLCTEPNAVWYAFESVNEHGNPSDAETADIDGEKGKCHRAIIRAVGTRDEATTWLVQAGCKHVPYAKIIADNNSGVYVGEGSTAIAGDESAVVIGHYGKTITGDGSNVDASTCNIVMAGDDATLKLGSSSATITAHGAEITSDCDSRIITGCRTSITAAENADIIGEHTNVISVDDNCKVITGHFGKISAGKHCVSISGPSSTAVGGICSTIIAGEYGNATTGNSGIAITTRRGETKCGHNGIAIAGFRGTVCGDEGSVLVLKNENNEPIVAVVGKNGIKPDTPYRLDDEGNFVEVVPF